MSFDIEIKPPDANKPHAGILRGQRVVPKVGLEEVADDLLRNPDGASEATLDDLYRPMK